MSEDLNALPDDAEILRRLSAVTRPARFPTMIPAFDPALFADELQPDEPLITAPEPLLDPISEIQAEYAAATARTTPRPETWDDIIGNRRAVTICRQACAAAKAQAKPLPHILLFGPHGARTTCIGLAAQIMVLLSTASFEVDPP